MSRFVSIHLRQAPKRTRARRMQARKAKAAASVRHSTKCKHCGCTNEDCRQCIEATGFACTWVSLNVCSRCRDEGKS